MRTGIATGLMVLAACTQASMAGDVGGRPRPIGAASAAFSLTADAGAAPRPLARGVAGWHGGPTTAATGEAVRVEISDTYPPEAVSAQAWADFFAGLVHGPELLQLTARIAPPDEVSLLCGGDFALGCYGGGLLVMPGEPSDGVAPETIARHEYGHHLAANRQNPPWRAIDWGTKRWASREDVCGQTTAGLLHPGDEGAFYRLNPGEAFAEAYRVLNERRGGMAVTWPLVDDRFLPGDAELSDVERDVLEPWSLVPARTVKGRFTARGPAVRRIALATPLDGILTVTLQLPRNRQDVLELRSADGGRVLSRGLWAGVTRKTLTFEVCGLRSVQLRLVRTGPPGPYLLSVTQP